MSEGIDKMHLIELVRDHPNLWDHRMKEYHNRDLKPESWDKIGKELNADGTSVKKAWDLLRDSYRRKLKSMKTSKNGKTSKNYPAWPFFAPMEFLRPLFIPSENSDNAIVLPHQFQDCRRRDRESSDDDEASNADSSIEKSDASLHDQKNDLSEHFSGLDGILNKSQRKRKHLRHKKALGIAESSEKKKLQYLQEDGDVSFLMSLVEPMKELDILLKMRVRMAFLEVLTQELEKK